MVDRLDKKAVHKVSGASWEPVRATFFEVARVLLSVSPQAASELTTIYVKFCATATKTNVYAVVWLRTKHIVVGLSLPDEVESSHLGPPPRGTKYKGLTRYLTLRPGEPVPVGFPEWARRAFATVSVEEGAAKGLAKLP